jgi:hypothetical protein
LIEAASKAGQLFGRSRPFGAFKLLCEQSARRSPRGSGPFRFRQGSHWSRMVRQDCRFRSMYEPIQSVPRMSLRAPYRPKSGTDRPRGVPSRLILFTMRLLAAKRPSQASRATRA